MNTINRIIRKFYLRYQRLVNRNTSFTLITQNCIGGVIYSNLGLQFQTPTINMFIEDDSFVKLVCDLQHYMQVDPVAITDNYVDPIDNSIVYPKIRIDDIEICCLHYKNCEEAIRKWNERKKRINYDNIYVIGNTWNMHNNNELISKLIHECKYKKVIFSSYELPYEEVIALKESFWYLDERNIIRPNITDDIPGSFRKYFEKEWNYVRWLNRE